MKLSVGERSRIVDEAVDWFYAMGGFDRAAFRVHLQRILKKHCAGRSLPACQARQVMMTEKRQLKFNNNRIGDCPECGVPLLVSIRRDGRRGPAATVRHETGGNPTCGAYVTNLTDQDILDREHK